MVSMSSALLIEMLILYTTSLEVAITIMMTGPLINMTIGPLLVMEIIGSLMVEAVKSLDDLIKSLPLGGLATMSSLAQDVVLGVRGLKDTLVGFEALLCMDPLPVVALQPWLQRESAKAGLPLIREQSTPSVKDPLLLGRR